MAMSWVEARPDLEWRWIQWIQIIFFGSALPLLLCIPETREGVILRRKAARMRAGKTATESVYKAKSEVNKATLAQMLKVSLTRPFCESSQRDQLPADTP